MAISAEYARVHYAAGKVISATCLRCGKEGPVDAALKPDVRHENQETDANGLRYSVDLNDYHPLCSPCHHCVDFVENRQTCKNGHPYTAENTRWTPTGRKCRTYHREHEAARLTDPETRAGKRKRDRQYRLARPMSEGQKTRKLELQRLRRAGPRR